MNRYPGPLRRRCAGLLTGALAFLAVTGCRPANSGRAAIPPSVAEPAPALAERTDPACAESSAPAGGVRVSKSITLFVPRSQETLDALYAGARCTNLGLNPGPPVLAERGPAAMQGPAYTPEMGASRTGWDVPLTRRWSYIVIHHSATETGSAASFDRAHKARNWDGLGYHFVIGNGTGSGDGEVETGYRWRQQERGAHAGNNEYNEHGVGICLVGNFEQAQPSARQLASLRILVRHLQAHTRIERSSILGHGHVPGKDTRCPGKNFDLAAFRASLDAGGFAAPARPLPLARPLPASATRSRISGTSLRYPGAP